MTEARRLKLHEILCEILGSRRVYFQPPGSVKMEYDAFRYTRSKIQKNGADNTAYLKTTRYELTHIYRDPDNELVNDILELPMSSHDNHYVADNLYHDVYTIYY